MSSPPAHRLSKLSLESMPPTTRSQSQHKPSQPGKSPEDATDSESASDDGSEVSNSSMEEDSPMIVRSPQTDLTYNISNLHPQTQELVRQLFHETPPEEPPQIVLQWCQLSQEEQGSHFYAFQMHEIVPRSIRIGAPDSRYPTPRCNCMRDSNQPCKHLIALLDQINYHTLDQAPDRELTLTPAGFAAEAGNPFEKISGFHLEILADCLHCDVGSPESKTQPNPYRIQESREILAAVAKVDSDEYRPDLFDTSALLGDHGIISRADLERTVVQMLLANNDFFAYFLKLLDANDAARDPFRKLEQRVKRVLTALKSISSPSTSSAPPHAPEGPPTVTWAASHLLSTTRTIAGLIQRPDRPALPWERASAARALVRILRAVVMEHTADAHGGATPEERNLYARLIGQRDTGFAVDTLALLPEQNQFIDELETIEEALGVLGAQVGFVHKLRSVIARLRASTSTRGGGSSGSGAGVITGPSRSGSSSAAGSKRSVGGNGREGGAKRAR